VKLLQDHITRFSFLAGLLFACEPPDDEYKGTFPIEIKGVLIPETGQVNDDIQIQAYVEAANGCYRDLEITLRQVSSQSYLLRATGYFESAGVCPAGIVSLDTTIIFKPTAVGTFYFQTNEEPFVVQLDTLTVN
jgi:hypothetical protein